MNWYHVWLKTGELRENSDVFFAENEDMAIDDFILQTGLSEEYRKHIEATEIAEIINISNPTMFNLIQGSKPKKTTIRLIRQELPPVRSYLKNLELVFFDGEFFYLDEKFNEMRPTERPGEVWAY